MWIRIWKSRDAFLQVPVLSFWNGRLATQSINIFSPTWRLLFLNFWRSNVCTTNIYQSFLLKQRSSMLTGYLEWWNWRVQVYLAHLVTWRLGPVVHQRKSVHRPPGESGGQWGCTPTGGYIAQLLLVECGAGRPGNKKKEKRSKEKRVVWVCFFFFADQQQARAIKPLIAQRGGTNLCLH